MAEKLSAEQIVRFAKMIGHSDEEIEKELKRRGYQ
jgi:hypothetical protein